MLRGLRPDIEPRLCAVLDRIKAENADQLSIGTKGKGFSRGPHFTYNSPMKLCA